MKTASFYLLAYIYLFSLNPIAAAPSPEEQQYIDFCAERFGPDTAIQPAEGGGFQCVMCAGSAYQDPVTGDRKCCNVLNESFSVDKVVQTRGGCCKAPLVFSYDPAAKAGKCCNPGHKFMAGACTPHEPSRPKCTQCSKNYACAHDGHLGLRSAKAPPTAMLTLAGMFPRTALGPFKISLAAVKIQGLAGSAITPLTWALHPSRKLPGQPYSRGRDSACMESVQSAYA
ncbi:predicted protein [Uncinocarpus reesii 1704]|uniref:Uncharacterized protein n=1 Tax=Uncinocarpus reesii (strain UAMH 1704) TaxID=336963 RepID=C4JQD8_UNCRE|nr:uncharacterized protein UREG_04692 [Uncinocarpus reesii 1704]EEP79846.1 predicted protein [Uncinocarpus reesii 1704]